MTDTRIVFDSVEELEARLKEDMLKHFTLYGEEFTFLNFFQTKKYDSGDGLSVKFFTDRHSYCIAANIRGYLGCTYSNRKPYPGEDWTRGRDLPDGGYSDKTWERIKTSILWEEMKPLSTEILSRLELEGIDTNNSKAKELADLRREQATMPSEGKIAEP